MEDFFDLVVDGVVGVEGGYWVLEDYCYVFVDDVLVLVVFEGEYVVVVEV